MKKFGFGLLITVVLVVSIIYVGGSMILSKALEQVLGVPVSVGKLHLSASEIGIYGLQVQNPKDFTEKTLASIPEIFVSISPAELFRKNIHIKQIRLNLDQITVERNSENKLNLTELAPLKKKPAAPAEPQKGPEPASPQEQKPKSQLQISVHIDEVVLNLGRARYVDSTNKSQPVVREFPLDIQNATLHDVTDPGQVVRQVVLQTMQKVGLNAMFPDVNQFSAALNTQAGLEMDKVKEGVSGLMKGFAQN